MFYEVVNLTHQFFLKTKIKSVTFLVEARKDRSMLLGPPCPSREPVTAVPTPAIIFMAQYGHKQAHLHTDIEYSTW